MVPKEGIEPSLSRENTILSRARLPIPPLRRAFQKFINSREYFNDKIANYNTLILFLIDEKAMKESKRQRITCKDIFRNVDFRRNNSVAKQNAER